MQITAVDQENNLFSITDVCPPDLVNKIMTTDWLSLPWQRQPGQETWARRRIQEQALPWNTEWVQHMNYIWPQIEQVYGHSLQSYMGTAWWLDEPGFTCPMHTDGELSGSIQLTWIGADPNLGTAFYWHKDPETLRYQTPMVPNSGYMMRNLADSTGYRKLLWHAMLHPVPENTFRLCSYIWVIPK